jgi:hypothetical protein
MKFAELFFVVEIFGSEIFGEVSFAHFSDSLVECKPI